MKDFNLASYKNTTAFLNSIKETISRLSASVASDDPEESLDKINAFLDEEDKFLDSLASDIVQWEANPLKAASSLGELLTVERLIKDLSDVASVSAHYGQVKDTLFNVRVDIAEQGGADFFTDVLNLFDEHINNQKDYIGHQWGDLHLERLNAPKEDVVIEESEEAPVLSAVNEAYLANLEQN